MRSKLGSYLNLLYFPLEKLGSIVTFLMENRKSEDIMKFRIFNNKLLVVERQTNGGDLDIGVYKMDCYKMESSNYLDLTMVKVYRRY